MKLGEMAYKPTDFIRAATEGDTPSEIAELVSREANKILAEKLERVDKLYSDGNSMNLWSTSESYYCHTGGGASKRVARLVCVEEIERNE